MDLQLQLANNRPPNDRDCSRKDKKGLENSDWKAQPCALAEVQLDAEKGHLEKMVKQQQWAFHHAAHEPGRFGKIFFSALDVLDEAVLHDGQYCVCELLDCQYQSDSKKGQ